MPTQPVKPIRIGGCFSPVAWQRHWAIGTTQRSGFKRRQRPIQVLPARSGTSGAAALAAAISTPRACSRKGTSTRKPLRPILTPRFGFLLFIYVKTTLNPRTQTSK